MTTQKILAAALAGLVAGAAIGLLMAPASGNETRQNIADAAGNLKNRFRRFAGKAEQGLDDLSNSLKSKAASVKDDLHNRGKNFFSAGKTYQNQNEESMGF